MKNNNTLLITCVVIFSLVRLVMYSNRIEKSNASIEFQNKAVKKRLSEIATSNAAKYKIVNSLNNTFWRNSIQNTNNYFWDYTFFENYSGVRTLHFKLNLNEYCLINQKFKWKIDSLIFEYRINLRQAKMNILVETVDNNTLCSSQSFNLLGNTSLNITSDSRNKIQLQFFQKIKQNKIKTVAEKTKIKEVEKMINDNFKKIPIANKISFSISTLDNTLILNEIGGYKNKIGEIPFEAGMYFLKFDTWHNHNQRNKRKGVLYGMFENIMYLDRDDILNTGTVELWKNKGEFIVVKHLD